MDFTRYNKYEDDSLRPLRLCVKFFGVPHPMFWWLIGLTLVALITVALTWRPIRRMLLEVRAERAMELFRLQREHLEAGFQEKAAANGKPRGLRWKQCDWEKEIRFARERHSRQVIALVAVNISFEAVEGGDMEGLPAVAQIRSATAVFSCPRGHWQTQGRVLFNMGPADALEFLRNDLERI